MRVLKSINNNIVSALDEHDREVVVIGRGIGFKAQPGTEIPLAKIDKVFIMKSRNNIDKMKDLFASLPLEYVELTYEIVNYAKAELGKRLNESIYITLADHLSFAVSRQKDGIAFQNALFTEIRHFYKEEYEVGLYALTLLKNKLGVSMPDDEAASIAIHILNAEYDMSVSNAFHATKLLDSIVSIVTDETGFHLDMNNYNHDRFINHLRFLAFRIIRGEQLDDGDDAFYEMLLQSNPKEMKLAEKVANEISAKYNFVMSRQELSYLAIHIKRFCIKNN